MELTRALQYVHGGFKTGDYTDAPFRRCQTVLAHGHNVLLHGNFPLSPNITS